MKGGFVSEVHVVIYCDRCGDAYSEHGSEAICFDSTNQAVGYLNARHANGASWIYDGDKVLCDGCLAAQRCENGEHRWSWYSRLARLRCCSVCGIFEREETRP